MDTKMTDQEALAVVKAWADSCAECEGRGYTVTYTDPYNRGDVSSPERQDCADCADIRHALAHLSSRLVAGEAVASERGQFFYVCPVCHGPGTVTKDTHDRFATPPAHPQAVEPANGREVVAEMVNRFLSWRVPPDFAPDGGISFTPHPYPECWPIGTNLLTEPQAKAMFLQCLPAVAFECMEWKDRALSAEATLERMADEFNRENGRTFMGEPVVPPARQEGAREGFVSLSVALAKEVEDIASEWLILFGDTPGLDKYEEYTYAPRVEEVRDQLRAMLAAAPKREGDGNG